ncbi:MAG: hypothetical protein NXI25_23380 [bacterium]|nr:hypothetical protein [bacterium]
MADLTKQLHHLLKQGAELFHPGGKAPLLFAEAAEDWKEFSTLTPEKEGLQQNHYQITAADFDKPTGKLYVAYSKTDYLQVRPVPFEALKSHRQLLEQWYLLLTREKLPQQAQLEQWPIQEDHCLQRVVLDALFQDCWYNHLSRSKPAYRQLDNLQLGQSLQLLSRMEREGKSLAAALNVSSLTFRGKI